MIPTNCAECLGLPIMPHTNGRRVGTADQHGNFTIQGWVELPALYQSVTDISHRSDTIYLQRSIYPLPAQAYHVSFHQDRIWARNIRYLNQAHFENSWAVEFLSLIAQVCDV